LEGNVSFAAQSLALATDADLGRALIAGHTDASGVAWHRFLPLVERMLRRALGGNSDIEDVAQAVFLCLFRRIHTLRDPVALRAFVIGITLRVVHEEVRRKRRVPWAARQPDRVPGEAVAVTSDAVPKHAFSTLYRLVRRLKPRERDAFVLRFMEGLNSDEVAHVLGVSKPTARRSFLRAHKLVVRWARNDPFLVDYMR
jgi:RNA polymerase sigma-70 factor (ECF subfamily)